MTLKEQIDNVIQNLLLENPDTVRDKNENELAYYSSKDNAIAFILYKNEDGRTKWLVNDKRNGGPAFHSEINRSIPEFTYPQEVARGRLWIDKKIASFYGNETAMKPYMRNVEELFKQLRLNIRDYNFEFGDSAGTVGLVPWPGAGTGAPEELEIPPEIKKQIAILLPKFHEATSDIEKEKIQKQLDDLYKKAGVENQKRKEIMAYIQASGEKKVPYEKGGGGTEAGYRSMRRVDEKKKELTHNDTLCPDVWPNGPNKIDPEVRVDLLRLAMDFYKDTELAPKIQDIYLLGSLANYNWTPQSDADVHIIIDSTGISMHPENTEKFLRSLVGKWNIEHEIKVKGHKVELYLQDVRGKNASPAVYSLIQDAWIKPPVKENVAVDKDAIKKKYSLWLEKVNEAIKREDEKMLKQILDTLRTYRQAGLNKGGEYSTENLVFKMLRHKGQLERIRDCYNQIYDKKMTVTDGFDPTSVGPNPEAQAGEDTAGFYQQHINRMKKLEENCGGGGVGSATGFVPAGDGNPKKDRLHIPGHRWQIRSKDAPKTPKMPGITELVNEVLDEVFPIQFLLESPEHKILKKNRKPLTDSERSEVMKKKAVWHHGPNGAETPAVWKSEVRGKTWYCCNTHRAIQVKPTLKGAIKSFEFIKSTS